MTEDDIRELVGELIVAGFDGTEVGEHAQRLIVNHHVKNIILFKRNVESAEQVRKLNADLQELAKAAGQSLPLIICTDQENGIVRRVAPEVPGLPGNMAIGATGQAQNAFTVGQETARELRYMGINMDLAPVLDVNNNPKNPVIGVRSYGEDPKQVAEFGAQMIQGLQASGVIACGKHFPGHGDTAVDSHLALPEISHPLSRLNAVELVPFMKAIEIGVDVIMTAHVVFSSIEPNRIPATLSKAVLTDFLRNELGYTGVVTTDCLEMNAISETIGVPEGAVQALLAGADLLMISHRLDRQEAAIEAIVKAVMEGRIKEQRLMEAASRVKRLREVRLSSSLPATQTLEMIVDDARKLQHRLCAAAATVVSNQAGLLPLSRHHIGSVDVLIDSSVTRMSASDNTWSYQFVLNALRQIVPDSDIRLHQIPDSGSCESLAELTDSSLVIAAVSGVKNSAYLNCVNRLGRAGLPIVAVALQSPYDLAAVSDVRTRIAVYEYTPWMVRAGIQALFGEGGLGNLPVTIH